MCNPQSKMRLAISRKTLKIEDLPPRTRLWTQKFNSLRERSMIWAISLRRRMRSWRCLNKTRCDLRSYQRDICRRSLASRPNWKQPTWSLRASWASGPKTPWCATNRTPFQTYMLRGWSLSSPSIWLRLWPFSNFSYRRRNWSLIKWLHFSSTPTTLTPKPRSQSMTSEESSRDLASNRRSQLSWPATLSSLLAKVRLSSMSRSRHKAAKSYRSCRDSSVPTICTVARATPMTTTLTSSKRNTWRSL